MDVRVEEIPMAGGLELENHSESFSLEDELLELYEAFYPNTCINPPPSPPPLYPLQQLITPSAPLSFHDIYNHNPHPPPPVEVEVEQEQLQQVAALQRLQVQQEYQLRQQQWLHHQQLQLQHQQLQPQQNQQRKAACSSSTSGIRKKRKKEQTKTVYRVPAENILTVDKWAWRKYGQKPIKGSPFPRNYYRCSSSKGCTARKQVERSITEPEVYVVTYSGDHFHPWPIHRNALAGVSRADHRTCVYSIPRDAHDNSATTRHVAVSEAPSPQLPPPEPSDEEEGVGLLIPNRMYVDEDMLRGMEELSNCKIATGSDSGLGFHELHNSNYI